MYPGRISYIPHQWGGSGWGSPLQIRIILSGSNIYKRLYLMKDKTAKRDKPSLNSKFYLVLRNHVIPPLGRKIFLHGIMTRVKYTLSLLATKITDDFLLVKGQFSMEHLAPILLL